MNDIPQSKLEIYQIPILKDHSNNETYQQEKRNKNAILKSKSEKIDKPNSNDISINSEPGIQQTQIDTNIKMKKKFKSQDDLQIRESQKEQQRDFNTFIEESKLLNFNLFSSAFGSPQRKNESFRQCQAQLRISSNGVSKNQNSQHNNVEVIQEQQEQQQQEKQQEIVRGEHIIVDKQNLEIQSDQSKCKVLENVIGVLEKKKQSLIGRLRKKAFLFLISNIFWIIIMMTTLIEFTNYVQFTKEVTDKDINYNMWVGGNGILVTVQVIWFFSSLIGIYGLYKFKRNCIKYYRVGIIISGLFEIISNAWIIPYIPIHITKSLLYIIIYIWFYCLATSLLCDMKLYQILFMIKEQSRSTNDNSLLNNNNNDISIQADPNLFRSQDQLQNQPQQNKQYQQTLAGVNQINNVQVKTNNLNKI